MKVTVDGKTVKLKKGARLKDALKGTGYLPGSLVSVHKSTERLTEESSEFEIRTNSGRSIFVKLDDGPVAAAWRKGIPDIIGASARWVTRKVAALGSFPTDLEVRKESHRYRKYDCFLSLGGFDNNTTYMMIAREDHRGTYGAGSGKFGRVTRGRHIVDRMYEGDTILSIEPVVSEKRTENIDVTSDPDYVLEDGYSVETGVVVELNDMSPESAEHFLVVSGKGFLNVTDETGSYVASSEDLDVQIPEEETSVRDVGSVTVRNAGTGTGRIYFYRERRQVSQSHNDAGKVISGGAIVSAAKDGEKFAVRTVPPRIMAVGMTQGEAAAALEAAGVKQVRTGETSDGSMVVSQTPEHTMDVISSGSVETFGVDPSRVFTVELDEKRAESVHFFRKVTGLSHKPIGELIVHFTYPGLPMVTFEGDEARGKSLYPQDGFRKCLRGDIGITNQARPHCGLIGIRLGDSKEYGPTGEEAPGTNIMGRFTGDLDKMMEGLEEGQTVYITEERK